MQHIMINIFSSKCKGVLMHFIAVVEKEKTNLLYLIKDILELVTFYM